MPPTAPPTLHPVVSIITFPLPSIFFSLDFAHRHCTLSRAYSLIDSLCTDTLAPIVYAFHRSKRDLPRWSLGGWLLLQGGVWRTGDEAAAECYPQCSIMLGSLGWLDMKEIYLEIRSELMQETDLVGTTNEDCILHLLQCWSYFGRSFDLLPVNTMTEYH